jgi:predicted metal-dependent hydrolase
MTEARTVLDRDGRAKAYRPLPARERRSALEAGLAAYESGDFFEAHELLEPAWMGTADPAERDAIQGLIKLAAAYVHAVRGNPRGVVRNLEGARRRVAAAAMAAPAGVDVDLDRLVTDIDERLARSAQDPDVVRLDPPIVHRTARGRAR